MAGRAATVAFGLDLSGFSRDASSVLAACILGPGPVGRLEILDSPVLSAAKRGDVKFDGWFEDQRKVVQRCVEVGRLAVDIPIDLQGLPRVSAPEFPWQLTMRPVDVATGALPPLASFLGAPVARFMHLVPGIQGLLGKVVFETYPAATLTFLEQTRGLRGKGDRIPYKGKRKDGVDPAKTRGELLSALRIRMKSTADIGDDRIDAAICAVTACHETGWLQNKGLRARLMERAAWPEHPGGLELPKGYLLPCDFPHLDLPLEIKKAKTAAEAFGWLDGLKVA